MNSLCKSYKKVGQFSVAVGAALLLAACSDDDDNPAPPPATIDFQVTVSNLAANQPLSPVAIVMHNDDWRAFSTGSPASVELEDLAESGSPNAFIGAADADANVMATTNGSAPIGPGGSETFDISVVESTHGTLRLSVVSMLVNTNDAIATINGNDISGLAATERYTADAITYDSGTEANSETAATIPGPVADGEGFNAARDDIRDEVHVHAGVVTAQDGLLTSALDGTHKWDHPAMRVTIERLN